MVRLKRKIDAVLAVLFFVVLLLCSVAVICLPKQETIRSERRKAAVFPEITAAGIQSGQVMKDLENYARDHMVFREELRRLKAYAGSGLFLAKENNGMYRVGDGLYRLEYPLDEKSVRRAASKFKSAAGQYFEGAEIYYAVIPDKNYFAAQQNGYPYMDYDRLFAIMEEEMADMTRIEIGEHLGLQDYYRTDPHWRQEEITDVAGCILEAMGAEKGGTYTEYASFDAYEGAYAAQSGWKTKPDTITCLTDEQIAAARVFDFETKEEIPVYQTSVFSAATDSMDAYDVYLSGAKALLTLENPAGSGGRELVLFRDSFGSSIAPLLLPGYSKITMIDLRYVTMEYADSLLGHMDLEKCDVLFLYSTLILNSSGSLR